MKRYTSGAEVAPGIFDDSQFKALLPYYTTFWSNWQFAGERARFQYLHDRVSSKHLRQLAEEAGSDPETRAVHGELLVLADEVDLFYGDGAGIPDAIHAVEPTRAGMLPNSQDTISISHEPEHESNRGILKPWQMPDYNMTQVISLLSKVEDPKDQRLQSQTGFQRAFIVRLLVDAWGRNGPEKQRKLLAGEWSASDLRFVLAILFEIHAKRIGTELDGAAIVRISTDMPWMTDPRFDLANGAFDKLPDTIKPQR